MPTVHRSMAYPLFSLTGTLLIIVAALLHPHLQGDGAAELAMIAHSDAWRAIHWAFLFGFPLSLAGLVGILVRQTGTLGEAAARGGVVVGGFAYGAWLVVVAFMLGTGWALARSYAAAEPGMAATNAVFVYDMLRPFALAAQRIAGFALGISTCLLGWGMVRGRVDAVWLGWSGVASGLIAVALTVLFGEATKADQAAFAPPVLWQLLTAGVFARRAGRP